MSSRFVGAPLCTARVSSALPLGARRVSMSSPAFRPPLMTQHADHAMAYGDDMEPKEPKDEFDDLDERDARIKKLYGAAFGEDGADAGESFAEE